MPTKPFYSLDEVCSRLGKTSDQIKAMVRDGLLREFRDAGKIFFKADDIERLLAASAKPEPALEDTGEILLEPVAEPAPAAKLPGQDVSSLTGTAGGTSIIGLEPLPEEEETQKGDTAVVPKGIGVLAEDEVEIDTDPMAKTAITTGAIDDQVSLEGAGSGSGLLDLAREADDTALGADLLDEIYPGEEEAAAAKPEPAAAPAVQEAAAEAPAAAEPVLQEAQPVEAPAPMPAGPADPSEGLFTGLLVGGLVTMAFAATIVASVIQGYLPDFGRYLGDGSTFYFFLCGALLTAVIGLGAGWFIGKAFLPGRR